MPGLILCATQRCGSTMIVEDIRNTGVLGLPEEYFIPWDSSKKEVDWVAALQGIKNKAKTSNGFYSIKVMANHLPVIDECLKGSRFDTKDSNSVLFPRFREAFKDCKFLMIRRDSIVRQAVSREMSRQTGVNHATKNENDEHFAGNLMKGYQENYNKKTHYNLKGVGNEVKKISAENALWESFFESNEIKSPLVLRYEEVCKNFPAYLTRISNFTNVPLEQDLDFQQRKMVRLSNSVNDEWVKSYLKDFGYSV
ncbi:hypothetical protein HZU72_18220 [Halomonas sp. QX-2]|uniref:Sulphotransferase Stf0 domain-containing protein n=1 Tax=Vreelandella sedimenti TaxID=2729618 RepID=A0A7Z0SNY9_9GAMM|nr:Stf0 family sulfotransferase [Halomonas sedimenti]NYT74345.1 hypothetical protein [Halomonas sedimenti]